MEAGRSSGLLHQTCRDSGLLAATAPGNCGSPRKDFTSLMGNFCYNGPQQLPTINYPGMPSIGMNFNSQPTDPIFWQRFGQQQVREGETSEATTEKTSSTYDSDSSSDSSSSSSSDTSSEDYETSTQPDGETLTPNYNYDFCTCDAPLPQAYNPPAPKPKKPKPTGPKAGIWCGSPCCAVAQYFPSNVKGVDLKAFPLKIDKPSTALPPGACCFKNGQLIFQMPEKARKEELKTLPMYNVGPDETPTGVKMIKPNEKPQADPGNNTYLLTINKTDDGGKPAKLELAIKVPRPEDLSVCETDRAAQYNPADFEKQPKRKSLRKSGDRRSRTQSWKKNSKVKMTKRKTRQSKWSKTSKVNFNVIDKFKQEQKI